jgi:hypothetical protein
MNTINSIDSQNNYFIEENMIKGCKISKDMLASKNFHTLGDTFKIELRSMVILIF